MAMGPNSLQMLKFSAPIPRGPSEGKESKAYVGTCENTYVDTQPTGCHIHPLTSVPGFFCLFWLDWGVLGFLFLLIYTARGHPAGQGKLPGQLPLALGPGKLHPSVLSSVWALRQALYPRLPGRRRSTWAGEWILHMERTGESWPVLQGELSAGSSPPRWPHQPLGHRLGLCIGEGGSSHTQRHRSMYRSTEQL